MPENGRLILARLILQFRRALKRNEKLQSIASVSFIAHLVNQRVAHELLALEVIQILLANPTNASVEVAIEFTKQVGMLLEDVVPKGVHVVFEQFRNILQSGKKYNINKRVQYQIDELFTVRRKKFKDYPSVIPQLDLVEMDDQITHEISLDDNTLEKEEQLDIFRLDNQYKANEKIWTQIRKEILGIENDSSSDSSSGSDSSSSGYDSDDESTEEKESKKEVDGDLQVSGLQKSNTEEKGIADMTEAELVGMRRQIYLTIMSSLDFEECAHKMLKMNIPKGLEHEVVNMLIECCSQERTYVKFYGLLSQRICLVRPAYTEAFASSFDEQYKTVHRFETNHLRNVAKLFAHLLQTSTIPWTVFRCVYLNEDDTTSSSRIFIKLLCQDMAESLGMQELRRRFLQPEDDNVKESLQNMFPVDNPRNTRFAINFFTLIGLGKLTDDLREHLKNAPKLILQQQQALQKQTKGDDDDDSSSSSSGSSSSSSDSDSSSSGYDSDTDTDSRRPSRGRSRSRSTSPRRKPRKRKRSLSSSSSNTEPDNDKSRSRNGDGDKNDNERDAARSGSTGRNTKRSENENRRSKSEDMTEQRGEKEKSRASARARSRSASANKRRRSSSITSTSRDRSRRRSRSRSRNRSRSGSAALRRRRSSSSRSRLRSASMEKRRQRRRRRYSSSEESAGRARRRERERGSRSRSGSAKRQRL
uniref:MI domain-containing protein n=1 Tax=Aplanochytrium stocchinoi TaxID=215587 RepID=A0A7S3UXZ2_9STRA